MTIPIESVPVGATEVDETAVATEQIPTTGQTSTTSVNDDVPQAPSKNALKKAAKAERIAAAKLERRAREKEAKKEKKRLIAEKRAAGELDDDDEEQKKRRKKPRLHFGGTVVVDLGFDNMMNEKEIISLCSQLAYTYSVNRSAAYPFSLIYTSLNGQTFDRLESMSDAGYKRWANTQWWHEGYERLWIGQGEASTGPGGISTPKDQGSENGPDNLEFNIVERQEAARRNVIYLTADSEEELTELDPTEIYIIGGICDHNRYKNLCLNKAKESGIRTARLPIGRYLASLPTRKVLTVNQVFEILLKWVETRNWEEALYSVIPKRKFQEGGKNKGSGTLSSTRIVGDHGVEDGGSEVGEARKPTVVSEQEQDLLEASDT